MSNLKFEKHVKTKLFVKLFNVLDCQSGVYKDSIYERKKLKKMSSNCLFNSSYAEIIYPFSEKDHNQPTLLYCSMFMWIISSGLFPFARQKDHNQPTLLFMCIISNSLDPFASPGVCVYSPCTVVQSVWPNYTHVGSHRQSRHWYIHHLCTVQPTPPPLFRCYFYARGQLSGGPQPAGG